MKGVSARQGKLAERRKQQKRGAVAVSRLTQLMRVGQAQRSGCAASRQLWRI